LSDNASDGILGQLSERHATREAPELLDAEENELQDELGGATVVSVDLAQLDAARIPGLRRVADVAERVGAGLLLTNVHDEKMADVVGIGLNARAVFVPPGGVGRKHLVVVPEPSEDRIEIESGDDDVGPSSGDLAWMLGLDSQAFEQLQMEQTMATLEGVLTAQPLVVPKGIFALETLPRDLYQPYYIDIADVSWNPAETQQTANSGMDFEVDLFSASDGKGKFVVVRPRGSSFHPGTLAANGDRDRGYFNYFVNGVLWPYDESILKHYDHKPTTTNAGNTFTHTTGWNATVGSYGNAPTVLFGFDAQSQVSTSIADYGVIDNTYGNQVQLDFVMRAAGGAVINAPQDLIKTSKWFPGLWSVRGLPHIATSQLKPEFEAIYRADPREQRDTRLGLQWGHRMARVWLDIPNPVAAKVTSHWSTVTMVRSSSVYVPLSTLRSDLRGVLSTSSLPGNYERRPVTNKWHPGSIVARGSSFVWRNEAGVEWSLTPDLASGKLLTGPDCPYRDDFTLQVRDGRLVGFLFQGEHYTRL
jgi:hypothetical protein